MSSLSLCAICCIVLFCASLAYPQALSSVDSAAETDSETESTAKDDDFEQEELEAAVGGAGANDTSDYEDYGDNTEGERDKHTKDRSTYAIRRVGTTYLWGKWEKWSKCANTCVQFKRRQCIKRVQKDISSTANDTLFFPDPQSSLPGCAGILKRFRMCKDDRCKANSSQMRDEQCAVYNTVPYKDKFYNWIGYEREPNECQLYCRPRDSDNFISMKANVMDGTPCEKPAVYYTAAFRRKAICVEGICRAVHSTGAIRPATTNDSQLRCGSVLCQVVSELFSKAKLSYGYNYVATIPAGAMNVSIKQLSRSDNLLALKTTDNNFIINGNNRASESGIYEYNEDVYDYNREIGLVTAKGPIAKPVVLLLVVRGLNTGIKYDYTLPVPSATVNEDDEFQQWNELGQPLDEVEENNIDGTVTAQLARAKDRRRRKFSWKVLSFGECNRSCGPGVQTPIFRCIRDSPTRFYSPKRCAFAVKPVFSDDIYHCNRGLCPAYWRAGDYGECRCAESDTEGTRTRYIKCVQEQNTGKVEEVAEALCEAETKYPDLVETCNCPNHSRRKIYARGPDKPARVYARLIGAPATTVRHSVYNSTAPQRRLSRDDRTDKAGSWLMSAWHECSTDCGRGFEYRSIYCDRTAPNTHLCDLRNTPEQSRGCTAERELEHCLLGVWFTSEWSNCTGDCFNLQRRRVVHCLLDGVLVNDNQCEATKRPSELSNCTQKDVDFCGPKWHYSEWSECSRSCGEGIQRRYAKCLEFDFKQNALTDSNKCKYLEREPVYGACNAQKCEELTPLDATQSDVQSVSRVGTLAGGTGATTGGGTANAAGDCSDEFSNCKRINRQRLCKLPYYKTYCCITCNGFY